MSTPAPEPRRPADLCVVGGAGHVGLPLSLVFASKGLRVLVLDVNTRVMAGIRAGALPFVEPGAEPLLHEALRTGRLELTDDPALLAGVPVAIVTVGTPVDEFHNPAFRAIDECLERIVPRLAEDALVVLRSTVYPGTTERLARELAAQGRRVRVAFCPERVVQGRAVEEVQTLPQIVSGATPEACEAAARLFARIAPSIVTLSPTEAEFAKLFCNAYRYVQFAVANQFFTIATQAGVDYYRILAGMKQDYDRVRDLPRAGFTAGPCLYKDTLQLAAFSNHQFSLGNAAMLVNEGLPLYLIERISLRYDLTRMTVGLLGMAFKAESDDRRASLSYKLKKALQFRARRVLTCDPYVTDDPDLAPLDTVLAESDLLILCTPHEAYRRIRPGDKPAVDIWGFWGDAQV